MLSVPVLMLRGQGRPHVDARPDTEGSDVTTSTGVQASSPHGAARRDGPVPPESGASRQSGRIEGLDGLRAIAIVAVLIFHLNASWLPGGFLGVDVFFVVSGFLITTLLVREHRSAGRIAFKNFWVRRARRLLPALAVCVTVSVLIARVVTGDLLVHVGRQVLGALTFSTNWVEITAGSSYFDQTAPQLFMNFWSLAVEEQFYLLWPLATLLLIRFARPRARMAVPLAIAAGSTVLMAALYTPGADATRVYYGTDTHLMGLMLGAGLAFAWAMPEIADRLRPSGWGPWGRLVAPGAAIVLGVMFLFLDESHDATFRGGFFLASAATTVLLISLLDRVPGRTSALQRLTDHPVATWIGVRSYSLYLWHWPVILIVAHDNPSAPGTISHLLTRAWCVLVTVALADLTFRFVETPFRVHGFRGVARAVLAFLLHSTRRTRQVTSASVATLALVLTVIVWTAPAQSETATMLEANAALAASGSALPPGAKADDRSQSGPAAGTTTGPTASATTPTSPTTGAATGVTDGTATAAPAAPVVPVPKGEAEASFTMPSGPEIDGYGDSMMVGSVHALDYYFPGIRMDATSNRRWSDGLAAIKAKGDTNRRAVVLAFGTNAGTDVPDLEAVLDFLGPRRMVVLVNLMGPFSRIQDDNTKLAEVAKTRPNVIIADWAAAVRDHPEQLQSDRIHPSLKGSHLFAKTVRAALATLSEEHTGTRVVLKDLPMP